MYSICITTEYIWSYRLRVVWFGSVRYAESQLDDSSDDVMSRHFFCAQSQTSGPQPLEHQPRVTEVLSFMAAEHQASKVAATHVKALLP